MSLRRRFDEGREWEPSFSSLGSYSDSHSSEYDPEDEKEDEDDDYDEDDEDRVRGRFLWHILLQHQASPREVSPCRRASELLLRLLLLLLLLLL